MLEHNICCDTMYGNYTVVSPLTQMRMSMKAGRSGSVGFWNKNIHISKVTNTNQQLPVTASLH